MMSWLERAAGGLMGKFQASDLSRLTMLSADPSTGSSLHLGLWPGRVGSRTEEGW